MQHVECNCLFTFHISVAFTEKGHLGFYVYLTHPTLLHGSPYFACRLVKFFLIDQPKIRRRRENVERRRRLPHVKVSGTARDWSLYRVFDCARRNMDKHSLDGLCMNVGSIACVDGRTVLCLGWWGCDSPQFRIIAKRYAKSGERKKDSEQCLLKRKKSLVGSAKYADNLLVSIWQAQRRSQGMQPWRRRVRD